MLEKVHCMRSKLRDLWSFDERFTSCSTSATKTLSQTLFTKLLFLCICLGESCWLLCLHTIVVTFLAIDDSGHFFLIGTWPPINEIPPNKQSKVSMHIQKHGNSKHLPILLQEFHAWLEIGDIQNIQVATTVSGRRHARKDRWCNLSNVKRKREAMESLEVW